MKPYIEIIRVHECANAYTVEYAVMGGETLDEAETVDLYKDKLVDFMNTDMPYNFYTTSDITPIHIKHYLTETELC